MSSLRLTPLSDAVGVEVHDLDLNEALDEATFAAIAQAFLDHGVLLFRNQALSPAAHVALSRRFGDLEHHVQKRYLLPGFPEILVIGNPRDEAGTLTGFFTPGDGDWHTDMSYVARPSLGSLFHAVQVPPAGGDTWFAGCTAAYEAMPDALRSRIDGRRALHNYPWFDARQCAANPHRVPLNDEQRARVAPVAHPLVRTHPVTGRRAVWLAADVISDVEGLDAAATRDLCAEVQDFVTQDRFVYRHAWRAGDLVAWDNRCTMHRASVYDHDTHVRVMHRTTVCGDVPF
ncbi:TauD/TfdA dioxygenase family protein [Zavarzinia sp. CC-PAN008]|uniref:TauD/TfdA dioxygenase family protein n=1 Tax=Zavarzinia sp. CC-PAN008 TaxID=3243332 RepID=UPI003F744703